MKAIKPAIILVLSAVVAIGIYYAVNKKEENVKRHKMEAEEREKILTYEFNYLPLCGADSLAYGCVLDFAKMDQTNNTLLFCLDSYATELRQLDEPANINFFIVAVNNQVGRQNVSFWTGLNFDCVPFSTQKEYERRRTIFINDLTEYKKTVPDFEKFIDDDCRPKPAAANESLQRVYKLNNKCVAAKTAFRNAIEGKDGQSGFRQWHEERKTQLSLAWQAFKTDSLKTLSGKDVTADIVSRVGKTTPREQYCLAGPIVRAKELLENTGAKHKRLMIAASLDDDCPAAGRGAKLDDHYNISLYEIITERTFTRNESKRISFRDAYGGNIIQHNRIDSWKLPTLSFPPVEPSSCGKGLSAGCLIDFSLSHKMEVAGLIEACAKELAGQIPAYRYSSVYLFILPIGNFPDLSNEEAPVIISWDYQCPRPPSALLEQQTRLTDEHAIITGKIKESLLSNSPRVKNETYVRIEEYNRKVADWTAQLTAWETQKSLGWLQFVDAINQFTASGSAKELARNLSEQQGAIGDLTCLKTAFWQAGIQFSKQNLVDRSNIPDTEPAVNIPRDHTLLIFSDMKDDCEALKDENPRLLFSGLRGANLSFYHFATKGMKRLVSLDPEWIKIFDSLSIAYEPKFVLLRKQK